MSCDVVDNRSLQTALRLCIVKRKRTRREDEKREGKMGEGYTIYSVELKALPELAAVL